MKRIRSTLEKVAATDSTVLILGETGTGKEVVARTLHRMSRRRNGPFLCVNCAALSAGLLESELFGHEKGAFTGAETLRKGRFELADGGSLLLDEVSEIDLNLQAKLLRALQEKAFERVGSSQSRHVNVRVMATSNRDLEKEVGAGRFREDLYYRLNVVPIRLAPLRERREDISPLIEHFLRRFGSRKRVAPEAVQSLGRYSWPGNVRELGNVLERALVLSGDEIGVELIAPWLEGRRKPEEGLESRVGIPLEEIELKLIELNLAHFKGNREQAAAALGISSRTLREKLKKREPATVEGSSGSGKEFPPGEENHREK
jgi:DNA-binding NtrC family response regulator